ncbi:DUF484 family protein, partial [Klebsiella pneumoniae]|nr:DUF484 family protein [Klebsiella pneumoniae]
LRPFPDRWRLGAPSNHTHLALSRQSFEPLRIQRLGQEQHYLGPLNGPELLVVLPEAKAVGLGAMSSVLNTSPSRRDELPEIACRLQPE